MDKNSLLIETFNDAFLAHVAELYYVQELSQTDIAARLGMSKMTVSRSLKRAVEKRIVRFSIRPPVAMDTKLSSQLEKLFTDISFNVVKEPMVEKEFVDKAIGAAYAFDFGLSDYKGKTIGIGIGSTVASFVQALISADSPTTTIVQILGGLPDVSFANPFSILKEMVSKLRTEGVYFASNMLVESPEVCKSLLAAQTSPGNAVYYWPRLDYAIFGIGRVGTDNPHTLLLNPHLVRQEEAEDLLATSAAAEILGHCLDSNGSLVNILVEERLASIPIPMLRQVKKRVALAGGPEKANAILAVLRSGLVTDLYTDQGAATAVLNLIS